jgi:transcriptional regulator with XRE-family HTH domain
MGTVGLGELIGVSGTTITDTENGNTNPDKRTLILLALVLDDYFGLEWLSQHAARIQKLILDAFGCDDSATGSTVPPFPDAGKGRPVHFAKDLASAKKGNKDKGLKKRR